MPSDDTSIASTTTPTCDNSNNNVNSNLKPCCACPDTRKLRDDCVFLNGEDYCTEYIEKHKECLRSYGFKI